MTREMKYSGVEWIGDIPSEWKYKKIKYVYSIKKAKLPSALFENELLVPYLTMDYIRGATDSLQYAKDGDYCDENDLLLIWDGSNAGEMVYNHPCGYAPSTTAILKLKCSMEERYSKYYLIFFETELRNNTNGMGIPHINGTFLRNSYMLFPPLSEQKKIADFLDGKVSEIDKIIAETKSSIENYKEYKQSVITEAVTKGLDKNVPMKDSGIEWIGDIPVGWEIMKIKHIGIARNGLTYSPSEMSDSEIGKIVLRSSNIKNNRLSFEDNVYVSKNIPKNLMVKKNDILICSRNGSKHLIGKNAIIENDISASFGAFMMIFRTKYNAKYIKYILDSNVFKYYLGTFLTATINQLTNDNFSNMKVVLCKDEKQQDKIVDYLDNRCAEIDNIISEKEKLISNLEEYKKSLIYEYVTGKRTVE